MELRLKEGIDQTLLFCVQRVQMLHITVKKATMQQRFQIWKLRELFQDMNCKALKIQKIHWTTEQACSFQKFVFGEDTRAYIQWGSDIQNLKNKVSNIFFRTM